MLKKLGLPVIALAAGLLFAHPQEAKAAHLSFGVTVGAPVYGYGYAAPVPDPYYDPYVAPPVYAYPTYGYYGGSYGYYGRGYEHHDWDRGRHYDHDRGWDRGRGYERGYRDRR